MKTKFFKSFIILSAVSFSFSGCLKDLDRSPFYGLNSESVYADPANYIHVLAKIYGGFSLSGNQGPAGKPDLFLPDEGFASYTRQLWNLQELPTDEAVCGWNDVGLGDLHNMNWTSENIFVTYMYYRIYYEIPLCNEFIRESTDDKLNGHGFDQADISRIKGYHEEARFLRALSYFHALDLFGNVPFVTELDLPGSTFPEQISRADLFNYIEGELLAVANDLPDPRTNEYGRVDKACAWTLLAKLYLNAEVYIGQQKYAECIDCCNKVIAAGYTLDPVYANLFLADNHLSDEIIFPITSDGLKTQSYGTTTFLVHAPVGGSMKPVDFGINGGWAGYRTTKNLVFLFPEDSSIDHRNLFYTQGQNLEINSITTFTDGYAIAKWKNITSGGVKGADPTGNFVDTDYPMFRLADVYLMYAEAVVRGGSGGDMGTAIGYVNLLRERAYGNTSGNVSAIDPEFVLAERGRELYWEATRRTDLIRYGKLTGGNYIWPWKGGVIDGTSVPDFRNLYPIPASDLTANTNLVQNPGY